MPITYQLEPELSVEEFIDLLARSTLGGRVAGVGAVLGETPEFEC